MIWFKNAQVYRLSDSVVPNIDEWQKSMEQHLFAPCTQQQPNSLGWVSAIPDSEALIHANAEHWLLSVQRQERLLPASVVREVLQEKVEQIRHSEDRRVGTKERQTLKDEVIFSLLPKAFVRTNRHFIYLNTKLKLLVVDAAAETRGDEITSFLRETLGSLPATLLQSHCQPAARITHWLKEPAEIPSGWELLPEVEFTQSNNSDIKVRLKNLELDSDAVMAHLEEDAQVTQIAVSWKERVEVIITAKAQLKRIRYSDVLTERAMEQSGDDKLSQYDASFMIMANELAELLEDIMQQFSISD